MTDGVIGVLGATGTVGRAVLGILADHRLRPGVRADVGELHRWATGCAVVINCTGLPIRDEILSAGADYVDPSACPDSGGTRGLRATPVGGDPKHGMSKQAAPSGPETPRAGAATVDVNGVRGRSGDRGSRASDAVLARGDEILSGTDGSGPGPRTAHRRGGVGRVAVYDAGAMPGAVGLLPRYLAARLDEKPARLVVEAGGLYRFTAASAREFLGARQGWRDQSARVNQALGLPDSQWATRFDGESVRHLLRAGTPTADQLIAASAADAAGRAEYLSLSAELTGDRGTVTTVALRAGPGLTAAVAALTALAVLGGEIPAGIHAADDVLDPLRVVPRLLGEEGTL